MIDVSTTISDYIAFLKTRKACAEAAPYLETTITDKCKYLKDLTAVINKGASSYSTMWSYWTLMDHGDQMSPELRQSFLSRIVKDPLMALKIYQTCTWLSDEEDELLISLFDKHFSDNETSYRRKIDG